MSPAGPTGGLGRQAPPSQFDPFADRTARDIRNRLSSAFVRALGEDEPGFFEAEGEQCLADQPLEIYQTYIRQRLDRYRQVFRQLKQRDVKEPLDQVTALWDHGLFFEVHELLEEIWQAACDPLKQALKGLIQAAGVYIHLQRGHRKAARGLARRSLVHLAAARGALGFVADLPLLMEKLRRLDPQPPRLSQPLGRRK
jgi:hypothetical protein